MQPPPTRYAERDGVSIAYQVAGEGPVDLVISPGFISHLDLQWTDPRYSRYLAQLASFARVIMYDKPGTGLSDPIAQLPTLEERAADIEAVMDAAGSERAVVMGVSEGGPTALVFSTTRPGRTISLILNGTFAVLPASAPEDYDAALVEASRQGGFEMIENMQHWGDGASLRVFAPSAKEAQARFMATFARAAASPRMARALIETVALIDVREILSAVDVPVLVQHVTGDRAIPVECGRQLAERIPGARLIEYAGDDHAFWFMDFEPIADDIQRFITGSVHRAEPDRILASVLFTDIVGSTEVAAQMGDTAWRDVLERHDALVSQVVDSYDGRVIKHIGDGALSSFSGPAKAVHCAEELCEGVHDLGLRLRAGVHTGECEAIGEDLGGMAVHIGARVGAQAGPDEIVVSGTVKDLVVGSGMQFADRGEHELKGVPGTWRLYALHAERAAASEPLGAPEMRRGDKVAVSLARRAPRMMRFGARMATRGA